MTLPAEIWAVIVQCTARALGGPRWLARQSFIATLSVARPVLEAFKLGLAADVRRLTEALIKREEAAADAKQAEAQKLLAEASEAANKANLHKRNDAIARAEKAKRVAEAAKTQA